MKIVKRSVQILLSLVMLVILLWGGHILYSHVNPKVYDSIAETLYFTQLEELESMADLIISVEVMDESVTDALNHVTLTKLTIHQVYKNNGLVQIGDRITIQESYATVITSDYRKYIASSGYYRPLKKGQHYILFLPNPPSWTTQYGIYSTIFCKYPHSKKLQAPEAIDAAGIADLEIGTEMKDYRNILKEIVAKYPYPYKK